VLHSCIILPPVGHSSYHEYHYCQLKRQTSCVLNFYCNFNFLIWISLVIYTHAIYCCYLSVFFLNTTSDLYFCWEREGNFCVTFRAISVLYLIDSFLEVTLTITIEGVRWSLGVYIDPNQEALESENKCGVINTNRKFVIGVARGTVSPVLRSTTLHWQPWGKCLILMGKGDNVPKYSALKWKGGSKVAIGFIWLVKEISIRPSLRWKLNSPVFS
jgi:hypothetical protein